jgi:hypothetical protein
MIYKIKTTVSVDMRAPGPIPDTELGITGAIDGKPIENIFMNVRTCASYKMGERVLCSKKTFLVLECLPVPVSIGTRRLRMPRSVLF